MINRKELIRALTTFHTDKDGALYSTGEFLEASISLRIQEPSSDSQQVAGIRRRFSATTWDFWYISTVLHRMTFVKGLRKNDQLSLVPSFFYLQCDVDSFLVKYRSIFDHFAQIIRLLSDSSGQWPGNNEQISFRELRHWAERNPQRIAPKLKKLTKKPQHFDQIRILRDSLVHSDGQTMASIVENRIVFQIHKNGFHKVLLNMPEVMYNENTVDFEIYASVLIAALINFREDLGRVVKSVLNLDDKTSKPQEKHLGMEIMKDWMEHALAASN
jgi:hypothetical protein